MGLLHIGVQCMSHIRLFGWSCVCVCVRESSRWYPLSSLVFSPWPPSPFYCKTCSALLSLAIITYTAPYRASLLWGLQIKLTLTHTPTHRERETHAHMVHTILYACMASHIIHCSLSLVLSQVHFASSCSSSSTFTQVVFLVYATLYNTRFQREILQVNIW